MDYIDKERASFEDWQDRQREQIEKVWAVMDYSNQHCELCEYKEKAEALFHGMVQTFPQYDFEFGFIYETEVNANDWEHCKRNFNKVGI